MSIDAQRDQFKNFRPNCKNCYHAGHCLPRAISPLSLAKLEDAILPAKRLNKGEYLIHADDAFESVYIVRTGAIKTCFINSQSEEIVLGCYLPSEIIGLEGIEKGTYPFDAVATETSTCCPLSYKQLEKIFRNNGIVATDFMKVLSEELNNQQETHLLLLGHKSARERIAACLMSFSARFQRNGNAGNHFWLPFTRRELGDYLDLTIETTSRTLHELQRDGLIRFKDRDIELLDIEGLKSCVGMVQCGLLSP